MAGLHVTLVAALLLAGACGDATAAPVPERDAPGRQGPDWTGYAATWRTLAAAGESSPADPFAAQLHGQLAALLGDYDYAHAHYFGGVRRAEPAALGLRDPEPALPALAALVEGRRVVMLNESHGHSAQRAANFLFVRELRRLGFTHLALEALAYEPAQAGACASVVASDDGLASRGHAIAASGHYLNDPIFAELVRMALAEGFSLVAYDDSNADAPGREWREQAQARNLACVLEADPGARMVVVGGGSHTSKQPDHPFPGGMMAARLQAMTGIEPYSISVRVLDLPGLPGYADGQPFFAGTDEGPFTSAGYDRVALVPAPLARGEAAHWLRLGGWRLPAPPVPLACATPPCLLEARRDGESDASVPGDRCLVAAEGPACPLFLAPGQYRLRLLGPGGDIVGAGSLRVPAGG